MVSANNRLTNENVDHGITFALPVSHRVVRITELIEQKIAKGEKFDNQAMNDIQMDRLDIQARQSTHVMLDLVEMVKTKMVTKYYFSEQIMDQGEAGIRILRDWDFRYELESQGAALFAEWEQRIKSNIHGWKIRDEVTRQYLALPMTYDDWLFGQIHSWHLDEKKRTQDFCAMEKDYGPFETDNCLHMLAVSYYEAI
jgi:hypothetical protein